MVRSDDLWGIALLTGGWFHKTICPAVCKNEQKEKAYGGCLVALWIISPFVGLVVWGYVQLILFFWRDINEDLVRRYAGTSPTFSEWATAWWETASLVLVVGVIGTGIVLPIYMWTIAATVRWLKQRD